MGDLSPQGPPPIGHGITTPACRERGYIKRFYRQWVAHQDLLSFEVKLHQSDLLILCDRPLRPLAVSALKTARAQLEGYIDRHRLFATSLRPLTVAARAPAIVRQMAAAGAAWQVGPMAAVAGAVAQGVAERLLSQASQVIVENGGDIYAKTTRPLRFGLYAGEDSPFGDRLIFEVDTGQGLGLCASSGRIGPSLSFGQADAVVALADDAAVADAAATALANRIRVPDDVDRALAVVAEQGGLRGVIACCGQRLGLWGEIQLVAQ